MLKSEDIEQLSSDSAQLFYSVSFEFISVAGNTCYTFFPHP